MAIVNIPDRVCPHCNGTRWVMEPTKTGFMRYRCPVLAQERRKRWKAKNPERALQHEKKRAAKRVAEGYFKKRRQSIINSQSNSENMSTTSFFYDQKEIKAMKELIRTGKPLLQIAREEHENYNATLSGFYTKLQKLAKNTTKIREWDGPKRVRRTKAEITASKTKSSEMGIEVPAGTTFEGTPKKVVIHSDHFRIYF